MNTKQYTTGNDIREPEPTIRPSTVRLGKRLLTIGLGVLLIGSAFLKANAEAYTLNAMQSVSCITTDLLTAPLTMPQRQVRHANNFNQLAPTLRPLYLHTVAY